MKKVTITRKIQVNFDVPKSELKEYYDKVFGWQRIVHKAANWIITHQYVMENVKEMFYFTDDVKKKLADIDKDADGILTTSKTNTTYQLLSKHFKGECPMGMLAGLNIQVASKYSTDITKIRKGEVSLASFRADIPMPIRSADINNWKQNEEDSNFSFSVYGVPFKTYFGKDLSRNQEILEMAIIHGKYKFCDSSLQLVKVGGKWKMFLLAVFSFDKELISVDANKSAICNLSINYPIVIKEKKDKLFSIGTAEEYLHRRNAIKGALHRLQKACKHNEGGHGRHKKLQAISRFEKLEYNYVNTKMHEYSRQLVDYCIKRGIGKIVLENYKEAVDKTHEETEESKYLLQSWSYYSLSEKIKYKANKVGIEVEIP